MSDGVDFERLAAGYRHRPAGPAVLERAGRAAREAGLSAGDVAIDVGGGPGDHAVEFFALGATTVVVDRSPAMARRAGRAGVRAVVGDGRHLPFRNGTARLVYFHSSLHYGGWEQMLDEAVRVAAPGGVVWVWTFAREHFRSSYLATWFPSVPEIDEARFPDPAAMLRHLVDRALEREGRETARETVSRTAGEWMAGVQAGFVSTLHLIDRGEIDAGLARFRAAHPDPDEEIRYSLAQEAVWAHKPSLA
jgi:ubiquinone/menaquinone biosynthesis C-methylase UbiE